MKETDESILTAWRAMEKRAFAQAKTELEEIGLKVTPEVADVRYLLLCVLVCPRTFSVLEYLLAGDCEYHSGCCLPAIAGLLPRFESFGVHKWLLSSFHIMFI
jgi:hypothetical protein